MKLINCIIRKFSRTGYKVVFIYEDGSRNVLPATMPLNVAVQVQKLFRK